MRPGGGHRSCIGFGLRSGLPLHEGSSPGAGQAPVRWVPSVCQGAVPPQVPMAPFCTRSDVDAAPVLCGAVRLSTPC